MNNAKIGFTEMMSTDTKPAFRDLQNSLMMLNGQVQDEEEVINKKNKKKEKQIVVFFFFMVKFGKIIFETPPQKKNNNLKTLWPADR